MYFKKKNTMNYTKKEIEELYKKSLKKLTKIHPKIEDEIEDFWNYVQSDKEDLTDNNFFEI